MPEKVTFHTLGLQFQSHTIDGPVAGTTVAAALATANSLNGKFACYSVIFILTHV